MPGTSWSVTGRGIAGLRAAEAETPLIPAQPAVLPQTTAGPALVLPAVATLQCTAQHRRDLAGVGCGSQRARGALVHGLRHTYATELANADVSVYTLMKLLGHESMTTSQRYVSGAGTENRAAAAQNPLYELIERPTSNR
jgi:integrase